jgi:hypothetical protein
MQRLRERLGTRSIFGDVLTKFGDVLGASIGPVGASIVPVSSRPACRQV